MKKDIKDFESTFLVEYNTSLKHRMMHITGEINSELYHKFSIGLTELEAISKDPITLRINSFGGSPDDALAIVGLMRSSECEIYTEGYGIVASAATLILAAGDKRTCSDLCVFMWHEGSYELEGRHKELKVLIKQREKEEKLWARLMGTFSKKPDTFWLREGVGEDRFVTPEELLEYGVIDEIAPSATI